MSYCGACNKIFHPDWCIESDKGGTVCCFCELGKDKLTLEDESGKVVDVVSRQQAHQNYMRYLKELSKKEKIAEVLVRPGV